MTNVTCVQSGQKYHKCGSYGKSFSEAGNLKIYIDSVYNDHKCDSSWKEFSLARDLKRHIKVVHNGQNITNVTHAVRHFL